MRRQIVARPAGKYGHAIPHCGTHLNDGTYVVHFNAEILQGTKPILGREVEIEMKPDDARDLAKKLVLAAETAEGYQRSRDHYHLREDV